MLRANQRSTSNAGCVSRYFQLNPRGFTFLPCTLRSIHLKKRAQTAKERFHLPRTLFSPVPPVFLVVQRWENQKCDWEENSVEKGVVCWGRTVHNGCDRMDVKWILSVSQALSPSTNVAQWQLIRESEGFSCSGFGVDLIHKLGRMGRTWVLLILEHEANYILK